MANHRKQCWYRDDPEMRAFCKRNSGGRPLDTDEALVHRECEAATAMLLHFQELGRLEASSLWEGLGISDRGSAPLAREVDLPSWETWLGPAESDRADMDVPLGTIMQLRRESSGHHPGRTLAGQIPEEEVPDPSLDPGRLVELMNDDHLEEAVTAHQPWSDNVVARDRRIQEGVFFGFPAERISRDECVSVQTVRDVSHEERQVIRGFRDLWIRFMGSYYTADTVAAIFGGTITAQHVRRIQKSPVSEWELGVGAALTSMFPQPGTQDEIDLVRAFFRAVQADAWGMPASRRDDVNHRLVCEQVGDAYEHFASSEASL
jgi:hypothetical protein